MFSAVQRKKGSSVDTFSAMSCGAFDPKYLCHSQGIKVSSVHVSGFPSWQLLSSRALPEQWIQTAPLEVGALHAEPQSWTRI